MPQGNESNESRSRLVKFNAPDEMLRELAGFAMLDNKPVNGVVNDAVSSYIAERRAAPTFPDELAAARERVATEAQSAPTTPEHQ